MTGWHTLPVKVCRRVGVGHGGSLSVSMSAASRAGYEPVLLLLSFAAERSDWRPGKARHLTMPQDRDDHAFARVHHCQPTLHADHAARTVLRWRRVGQLRLGDRPGDLVVAKPHLNTANRRMSAEGHHEGAQVFSRSMDLTS